MCPIYHSCYRLPSGCIHRIILIVAWVTRRPELITRFVALMNFSSVTSITGIVSCMLALAVWTDHSLWLVLWGKMAKLKFRSHANHSNFVYCPLSDIRCYLAKDNHARLSLLWSYTLWRYLNFWSICVYLFSPLNPLTQLLTSLLWLWLQHCSVWSAVSYQPRDDGCE